MLNIKLKGKGFEGHYGSYCTIVVEEHAETICGMYLAIFLNIRQNPHSALSGNTVSVGLGRFESDMDWIVNIYELDMRRSFCPTSK